MERRECASQNAIFKFNYWEVLRQRIIRDLQEVIQSDLVRGLFLMNSPIHGLLMGYFSVAVAVARLAVSCAHPSARTMAQGPTLPWDFIGPTSRKALTR